MFNWVSENCLVVFVFKLKIDQNSYGMVRIGKLPRAKEGYY